MADPKCLLAERSPSEARRVRGCRIHWAIVVGESGPRARPIREEWVTEIREQCVAARVPFFFKQWGGTNKKKTGRLLEGRTWDEKPDVAPPSPPGRGHHLRGAHTAPLMG